MKRIHIGLEVKDLEASMKFYTALFGAQPSHREADYAKWMLEDPRVNFSIQCRGPVPAGTVHFGVQVENEDELAECTRWLKDAGENVVSEPGAVCCYHVSDKIHVADPDALPWETFLTHGVHTEYGESRVISFDSAADNSCCE